MVYLLPTFLIPGRVSQASDQVVTYRENKPGLVNLSDLSFGNSQPTNISAGNVTGLAEFIQSIPIPVENISGLLGAIQATGLPWILSNTGNFTAEVNGNYFINNSASPRTITLPSNPQIGDTVRFILTSTNFVTFNTSKYLGVNSNALSNISNRLIEFIYCNSDLGWMTSDNRNQYSIGSILNWSSNGDTNGLFHHLGTNYGTQAWSNPHNTPRLTITTAVASPADPQAATDRNNSSNLAQSPGSGQAFVTFDLVNRLLIPNRYTLYRDASLASQAVNWSIQGSNNNTNWDTLHSINLAISTGWVNYQISTNTAYRYLRFLLATNGSSSSTNNLRLHEIEFYGTLLLGQ